MKNRSVPLILFLYLLLCFTGCAVTTTGEGTWEICIGIHTKQISEHPARVGIESSVVDKIVESLTDGKISPDE